MLVCKNKLPNISPSCLIPNVFSDGFSFLSIRIFHENLTGEFLYYLSFTVTLVHGEFGLLLCLESQWSSS